MEATCLHPNASTRARSQPQNTPGIAEATELRLQWEGTEAPERSSSTAPHRSHNRPAAWTPLCASAKPAQLDEPSMLSASCQGIPWTTGSHKTPRHPTACHQVRASGSGPRAPGPRVTEVWPPIWDPLASSPSTGGGSLDSSLTQESQSTTCPVGPWPPAHPAGARACPGRVCRTGTPPLLHSLSVWLGLSSAAIPSRLSFHP